jgi:hypothetical protein
MSEPFDIEKYRSISILGKRTRRVNKRETQLERDRASYKRLRADGIQPAQISGSAELEQRATMPIEFEMNQVFSKEERPHVEEGMRISEEIGLRSPYDR